MTERIGEGGDGREVHTRQEYQAAGVSRMGRMVNMDTHCTG